MIRPDTTEWIQTPDDLRHRATASALANTGAIFVALSNRHPADERDAMGRADRPVRRVRDGLGSRLQRTRARGGDLSPKRRQRPLFAPAETKQILETIAAEPEAHGLPGSGWTLKKLRQWVGKALRRTAYGVSLDAAEDVAGRAVSWNKWKAETIRFNALISSSFR